jgi:hypothetical protein
MKRILCCVLSGLLIACAVDSPLAAQEAGRFTASSNLPGHESLAGIARFVPGMGYFILCDDSGGSTRTLVAGSEPLSRESFTRPGPQNGYRPEIQPLQSKSIEGGFLAHGWVRSPTAGPPQPIHWTGTAVIDTATTDAVVGTFQGRYEERATPLVAPRIFSIDVRFNASMHFGSPAGSAGSTCNAVMGEPYPRETWPDPVGAGAARPAP